MIILLDPLQLVEFNAGHKSEITYVQWKRETNSISVQTDKRGDLASRSHCISSLLNSEQFSGNFLNTYLDNKNTDQAQSKLTLGHNFVK